jgi:hypothetical protein
MMSVSETDCRHWGIALLVRPDICFDGVMWFLGIGSLVILVDARQNLTAGGGLERSPTTYEVTSISF